MAKVEVELRNGVLAGAEASQPRQGAAVCVYTLQAGQNGGKDDRFFLVYLGIYQLWKGEIFQVVNMKVIRTERRENCVKMLLALW